MPHEGASLGLEPTHRPVRDDSTLADREERANRADRVVVGVAVTTMLCAFALVCLGSTVRVTNSGMGCPSWPLCYGHVGPIDRFHALLEQSHRYLAGLVTVGAVATALLAYRARARRMAFPPALGGACLVVVQAALGALTVLAKNAPWTVAVHLVVGLTFLAVTVVTVITAVRAPRGAWHWTAVGGRGWGVLAAMLAAIVGGSLVVANGAGGACPAWPLCPSSAPGLADWQLVHRSLAGIAGIALVWFIGSRWRETSDRRAWRAGAVASLGLFVAVAAFGAASAITRAAPVWQDLHLPMVGLLWGLVVAMVAALATYRPLEGSPDRAGGESPTQRSVERAAVAGRSN